MTRRKRKMENRKSNYTGPCRRSSAPDPIFHFLFSIFCSCALLGCAAPGEPTYRHPPVPEAIGGLECGGVAFFPGAGAGRPPRPPGPKNPHRLFLPPPPAPPRGHPAAAPSGLPRLPRGGGEGPRLD